MQHFCLDLFGLRNARFPYVYLVSSALAFVFTNEKLLIEKISSTQYLL